MVACYDRMVTVARANPPEDSDKIKSLGAFGSGVVTFDFNYGHETSEFKQALLEFVQEIGKAKKGYEEADSEGKTIVGSYEQYHKAASAAKQSKLEPGIRALHRSPENKDSSALDPKTPWSTPAPNSETLGKNPKTAEVPKPT
ncbi:hypothetical protein D5S18_13920 [Nocardia panacis]|uniref:Uncharacterized protein n=1 Tax=Nocardia panacis TaxID=2340916 RepID=A0A3A4KC66_9NOCA|nr:hypothetical protein D5S18_13920 [Nocardia panacis]